MANKPKKTLIKEVLISNFGDAPKETINICVEQILDLYKKKPRVPVSIEKSSITDPFALSVIKLQEEKIGKELTLPQVLIEYYKTIKMLDGIPGWDEMNFKKFLPMATELLNILGVEAFKILRWFSTTPYKWSLFTVKYNYQWYYQRGIDKEQANSEKSARTIEKYRPNA